MLAPSHPMEAEMPAQSPARPALEATSPSAYRAMIRLDGEVGKLALDERLRRLIELRVSQLNGCAYCLAMHTVEARNADVDESAIATVAAWHESPFFSDAERAALALADSVTSPASGHPGRDLARGDDAARRRGRRGDRLVCDRDERVEPGGGRDEARRRSGDVGTRPQSLI